MLYPYIAFLVRTSPSSSLITSSLRLARARNKDNKKVIVIIQLDNSILVATLPKNRRKTNPVAIQQTSRIANFFKIIEYAIFNNIYAHMIQIPAELTNNPQMLIEKIIQDNPKITPSKEEISPLAKGLFFFSGCFVSASRSNQSLNIYTVLAAREKAIKAKDAPLKMYHWFSCPEKKTGANTNPFLIQCFGRNIII